MYKKPDFIKVDVNIKDNFANYSACEGIWDGKWSQFTTASNPTCQEEFFEGASSTYNGGSQCYTEYQNIRPAG